MKKKVILFSAIIIIAVASCGCGKGKDATESSESSSSTIVSVENTPKPSTSWVQPSRAPQPTPSYSQVEESKVESSESSSDSFESSSEQSEIDESYSILDDVEEPTVKGAESEDDLKGVYSDINLSILDTDISFDDYAWFSLPNAASVYDYPIYQIIVCAINEFYGGVVNDIYTCDISSDIISMETNMVFSVSVKGENGTLIVGLNMYENTASVTFAE